jgi:hypothetical protein
LPIYLSWDIIPGMNGINETGEDPGTILCKACGLCCTGHLFAWVKLKSSELDPAEKLGLNVFRSDPTQRGFNLPCPLWKGQCTIHSSPNYPRTCRAYLCKLLKEVLAETTSLNEALVMIEQAKGMIVELEDILPVSNNPNFRERLVAHIEHPEENPQGENSYQEFRLKADALLKFYEMYFGVTGFLE